MLIDDRIFHFQTVQNYDQTGEETEEQKPMAGVAQRDDLAQLSEPLF
jgi:hypothetical protein